MFPSEPQSPEQAPASPPEQASICGIPPESRPASPNSPDYDDFYRTFGDLSPLTPPASAVATTVRRQRAHTLATQPVPLAPRAQPVLPALAAQPVPPAPAAQLVLQAPAAPALPAPAAQPAPVQPPPVNPAPHRAYK